MTSLSTFDDRHRTSADRGETLIELLVALVVMSTAVVALVGGIATSVRVSDMHRKQTTAGSYVRAFAETLQSRVAESPTGYLACGAGTTPLTTYQASYTVPDPVTYQRDVIAVAFWNPGTLAFVTCPAAGDAGVQRVSLRVRSLDGRAAETLDIVIRKPCRAGDGCT